MDDELQEMFQEVIEAAMETNAPSMNPRNVSRDAWNMLHTFGIEVRRVGDEDQQQVVMTPASPGCDCQCPYCRIGQHHLCYAKPHTG